MSGIVHQKRWSVVRDQIRAASAIDARAVSVFRVVLALILLGDLLIRAQDIEAHYTDRGVLPLSSWWPSIGRLSPLCFFSFATDVSAVELLFAAGAIIYLLLLLGRYTRLVTLLAWLFLLALQQRNPLLLNAGDNLLRLLLGWGMFIPLEGRWAWDRWRAPMRGPDTIATGATAALLLQVCVVYWDTAYWKSNADWWTEADALSNALSFEIYATGIGNALLNFPSLLRWMSRAVLIFEWIGPTVVVVSWRYWRVRTLFVGLFIMMHLSLAALFTLGLFPYVSVAGWLLFLPPPVWDSMLHRKDSNPQSGTTVVPAAVRFDRLRWILPGVLVFSCLIGHRSMARQELPVRARIDVAIASLGLVQSWKMFAHPSRNDGWFEVEGIDVKGERWDLLRGQRGFVAGKPVEGAFRYTNHRWRKYMNRLRKSRDPEVTRLYAQWQCRSARRFLPAGLQLATVRVGFILEFGAPPPALRRFGRPSAVLMPLGEFACGRDEN